MRAHLAAFLFFIACLALVPAPAAAQDDDRGFLTRLIEDNLSDAGRDVRVIGFEGALSSRARVAELTIADADGIWLSLRGVELDWNRAAALRGRIEVNSLRAAEIDLFRPPRPAEDALPSPEATPFALPDLPVSLRVGEIAAERVTLGEAVLGVPVEFRLEGAAELAGGEGTARLNVERTDGSRGLVALDGGYSNTTRMLRLALSVDEAEGGIVAGLLGLPGVPAIVFEVSGEGPIDDFDADIRLASDGEDRLAGRVTLLTDAVGQGFSASIAGDVAPLFLPEYREFFGPDIRLDATGRRSVSGALDLSELRLEAAEVALDGRVRIDAAGAPELLDIDLAIRPRTGGDVLLPLSGPPTRLGSARLSLGFDAAQGSEWRLSGAVEGLAREDIAIARLTLDGGGEISELPAGGATIGGTLSYGAEGLVPADPALAAALGTALSGRISFATGGADDTMLVDLPQITLAGDNYALRAALQFFGPPTELRIAGEASVEAQDFARFSALAGQDLGGSGRVDWRGDVLPLSGGFDGRLRVAGRDISVDIPEVDGLLRGDSTVILDAARGPEGLQIRALDLRATSLRAQAAGWLRSGGSDLRADLAFDDLSVLGPGYAGRMTALATVAQSSGEDRIALTGAAHDLRVGVAEVDGLLRGETRLRLEASRMGVEITVQDFGIEGAVLSASGSGRMGETSRDAVLQAVVRDLAAMGGDYRGRLEADVTYSFSDATDRFAVTGLSTDLAIGQPEVDGLLRGPVRLRIEGDRTADGTIRIADMAVNGASVRASGAGLWSDTLRDVSLEASLPDLRALGGPYRGSATAQLAYGFDNGTDSIRLTADTRDLAIGQAEADLLLRGASTLRLEANRRDGIVRVDRLQLDNPQVTARVEARLDDARRRIGLTARLADLALLVPGVPGALTLDGRIDEVNGSLEVDLSARGPGGIEATATGTVAQDFSRLGLRLQGRAETALANAFVAPVSLRGPVRFDLAVNGPPALGSVSGRIEVSDTRLAIAAPALAFRGLRATADLSGGRAQIAAQAELETGGTLLVAGPVALSAPFNGDLQITLDQLLLRDPSLYTTRATGALNVSGPLAGGARIAGRISLSETELRIPSSGLGGTAAIPDLQHVGEPAAVRRTRGYAGLIEAAASAANGRAARPYPLDVTIDAPNRIFIRGRGLDAELGGSLTLGGTTANVMPSGGFDLIRGRLDLLGKRFTLDEGSLRMEGGFIPQIKLAATTETDGVRATISVLGPADEPLIRFSSAPELPEEEVVARLLFGRGLNTLTPIQAAQLASAVATLTGRGGGGVVDRLRRSFGLDDLDVTQSENGAAALRAGRYLSRNLYADVVLGSDGTSEISLNLDVSRSLTVRGRAASDGTTGLGIYFERDY